MSDAAHVSQEELANRLRDAAGLVEVGGRYVHFKDASKEYMVTGLVIIEATEEVGVVYQAQYAERIAFLRPLSSFTAEVPAIEGNGQMTARFRKI